MGLVRILKSEGDLGFRIGFLFLLNMEGGTFFLPRNLWWVFAKQSEYYYYLLFHTLPKAFIMT